MYDRAIAQYRGNEEVILTTETFDSRVGNDRCPVQRRVFEQGYHRELKMDRN